MIIILTGHIGRTGLGGSAWANMQYLAGLQALGHDVYYLEDTGEALWVYDWEAHESTTALDFPRKYIHSCLEPLGLQDRWMYRSGNRSEGIPVKDFRELCSQADLLIVRGAPISAWRDEYDWPRSRVFIDVDPGFTQASLAQGSRDLLDTVGHCEHLFTVGLHIGSPASLIPTLGRRWLKVVPPVSLPHWSFATHGAATHFTSLMRARGFHDISFNGVFYGQKDAELPKFIDLTRHTRQPFLMAHMEADSRALADRGWSIVEGWIPSSTPWSYRTFIQSSRAEFGLAKHGYVEMRTGWFSDRTVCYLASGRPALVQDTGFSDWIPTGNGLLAFRDMSEALSGIETINADYERHRRAARLVAEEYFAADRVLPAFLEAAMG